MELSSIVFLVIQTVLVIAFAILGFIKVPYTMQDELFKIVGGMIIFLGLIYLLI